MNQIQSVKRSLVSLSLPRRVPALITYAEAVLAAMTNTPNLPTPLPARSAISAG